MREVTCPSCQRRLHVEDEDATCECQCPKCGRVFRVTAIAATLAPPGPGVGESFVEPAPDCSERSIEIKDFDLEIESETEPRTRDEDSWDEAAGKGLWSSGKMGARIGGAVGCIAASVALFEHTGPDLFTIFWSIVGLVVVGLTHGVLIALFVQRMSPYHRVWGAALLISALGGWLAVVVGCFWGYLPLITSLLNGAATGLGLVFTLWLAVVLLLAITRTG